LQIGPVPLAAFRAEEAGLQYQKSVSDHGQDRPATGYVDPSNQAIPIRGKMGKKRIASQPRGAGFSLLITAKSNPRGATRRCRARCRQEEPSGLSHRPLVWIQSGCQPVGKESSGSCFIPTARVPILAAYLLPMP
jgi:hypothetical protein